MKYTHIIATLFLVHCTLFIANAQVAINIDNSNPDSSAILDIKSTNKGFLYPRMNTAERDAIPNPSIGLTIFNLDDKCTDIYDGNAWMKDCPLMLVPDSLLNSWKQKANVPVFSVNGAVGFSINGKGYIGTGKDSSFPLGEFWEYDPSTDTWIRKANFGGTPRMDAVGFSINGKGYIGTGLDESDNRTKDFWEYNPSTDTWTRKADFGGTPRMHAVGFSINGKGYIGTGNDGGGKKDFWEYDPDTDTWTQRADFPGTVRNNVGFSIDDKGYIGIGYDGSDKKDFWEYDPTTDSWIQKTDFPGLGSRDVVGFSINGKGYIGTGLYGTYNKTNDFWQYTPSLISYKNIQPLMGSLVNPTLGDINDDTKIQVEESPNEDIIRFDIAGREVMNMDADFPLNIIADSINRHVLKLSTTLDTAVWHLRLQGSSNKDLGFTETSVADNRLVLQAGGNIGIGTANPSTTLEVNGTVTATAFSGDGANLTNISGDDLGNHIATQNIQLNNQWLSGDGGNEGIQIDNVGNVGINISSNSTFPLTLKANTSDNFFRFQHSDNTEGWHIREQGAAKQDLGFSESGVADNRLVLAAGGNIGIGIANPNVALDVNGDIEYTGTITDVSDRRLKENLLPISAVLAKLLQLQAYSYHMKDDAAKTREYGLLAQEVQKVFPELVSNIDAEGEYLGLSYIQLIPILLEGMKEQQAVINQLTMENGALKTQMQTQNQEVKARLSQIEALLSQKEMVETNTTSSENNQVL